RRPSGDALPPRLIEAADDDLGLAGRHPDGERPVRLDLAGAGDVVGAEELDGPERQRLAVGAGGAADFAVAAGPARWGGGLPGAPGRPAQELSCSAPGWSWPAAGCGRPPAQRSGR